MAIDDDAVKRLIERAHRDVDSGLLPSAQVALAYEGELVAFETIGDATDETRYVVFSATKAFVAGAMWALIADGLVDVSNRVVEYVPEFATFGKDVVTVEQVMLHTAGFPTAPLSVLDGDTSAGRCAAFARWRLNWPPGTAYEYHPSSAHWVLAEIIERVTGRDFRDVVQAACDRSGRLAAGSRRRAACCRRARRGRGGGDAGRTGSGVRRAGARRR